MSKELNVNIKQLTSVNFFFVFELTDEFYFLRLNLVQEVIKYFINKVWDLSLFRVSRLQF